MEFMLQPYSRAQLAEAQRDMQRQAGQEGAQGRIGRTGRRTMRIDQRAFFNAIENNGGVDQAGKTIWDDAEFCRDMERRHPECAVKYQGQTFGMFGGEGGLSPRNRFGRVTYRKVYA